jgi:hypothetical protein
LSDGGTARSDNWRQTRRAKQTRTSTCSWSVFSSDGRRRTPPHRLPTVAPRLLTRASQPRNGCQEVRCPDERDPEETPGIALLLPGSSKLPITLQFSHPGVGPRSGPVRISAQFPAPKCGTKDERSRIRFQRHSERAASLTRHNAVNWALIGHCRPRLSEGRQT